MGKIKGRRKDQVLAILLSVLMLCTMLPTSLWQSFATETADTEILNEAETPDPDSNTEEGVEEGDELLAGNEEVAIDLSVAIAAVEELIFVSFAGELTQSGIETLIQEKIEAAIDDQITAELVETAFNASTYNDAGSYSFKVKLSYDGEEETAEEITVEIQKLEVTQEVLDAAAKKIIDNKFTALAYNTTEETAKTSIEAQVQVIVDEEGIDGLEFTVIPGELEETSTDIPGAYTFDVELNYNGMIAPAPGLEVEVSAIPTYDVTYNDIENVTIKSSADVVAVGETVTLTITAAVGYRIQSVIINEYVYTDFDENTTEYTYTSEGIIADTEYDIEVELVKTFEVTIEAVENGSLRVNGVEYTDGATLVLDVDTDLKIVATPDDGYYVYSVGALYSEFVSDDKVSAAFSREITLADDITIAISFEKREVYDITFETTDNGTVSGDATALKGEDVTVTIEPKTGYTIDTVMVNNEEITTDFTTIDTVTTFVIADIEEDKTVEVTFKETSNAASEDVSFNSEDAIREEDGVYVYAKAVETVDEETEETTTQDTVVTFATVNAGIKISGTDAAGEKVEFGGYDVNSVELTETIFITKISLYYQGEEDAVASWHDVELDDFVSAIVIDVTEAEIALTPSAANENGYYNSNVSIAVKVDEEDYYSGIASITYTINGDETIAYTYDNEIIDTWSGSITVDADEYNADDVAVVVTVVDNSGNESSEEVSLDIDSTDPTIAVTYLDEDSKVIDESEADFYGVRTVTVVITQRTSTFDDSAEILITATDANGDVIVIENGETPLYTVTTWTTADAATADEATHSATITFNYDANYDVTVNYTNKADNKADQYADSFTIDTKAPTGEIGLVKDSQTLEFEQSWNSLVTPLDFVIYKNSTVTVKATGEDATTAVAEIAYYVTDNKTAKTAADLEDVTFVTTLEEISDEGALVVYARITDEAGNVLYIGTNGVVIDTTASSITLTPSGANENGYYNEDFNVAIKVTDTDEEIYTSGIASITYTINGDETIAYTYDGNGTIIWNWDGSIMVDAIKYNEDGIKLVVTVVDNAGNESSESIELNIDSTDPTIAVTYLDEDSKVIDESEADFYGVRTATVVITQRTSTFSEANATKGITITATDSSGNVVEGAYTISGWTTDEGDTADEATHSATITFNDDANYVLTVDYTDNAGNQADQYSDDFTIDTTNPTGEITVVSVEPSKWEKIIYIMSLTICKTDEVEISATAEDATSEIVSFTYYIAKTDVTSTLTVADLDTLYAAGEFTKYTSAFEEDADETFAVYTRLEDEAGNVAYLNTDGYIIDNTPSTVTITPDSAEENYDETADKYGIYNNDFDVAIKAEDSTSGIDTIVYWIGNNEDGVSTVSQEELEDSIAPEDAISIYELNADNVESHEELLAGVEESIEIEAEENNGSNVVVYFETKDTANNYSVNTVTLDIDTIAPAIDVSYDNNEYNANNVGYFANERTATIVITERTDHFDKTNATAGITIKATDASGNAVEGTYKITDWETVEGETPDEATHTAEITFDADANYEWSISYTDDAGNVNETVVFAEGTVSEYEFTIDKTPPTGEVSIDENSWIDLASSIAFDLYSDEQAAITMTAQDETSYVDFIEYYVDYTRSSEALTADELDEVEFTSYEEFEIDGDNAFVVYVKLTDASGNYSYISSNAYIVDTTDSDIVFTVADANANGYYNDDVDVSIDVAETYDAQEVDYSGISTIDYTVTCDGVTTQSGNLYTFGEQTDLSYDELINAVETEITVLAEENDSDDVVVTVTTTDNAGNEVSESIELKISATAPEATIEYLDSVQAYTMTEAGYGYYGSERTATITVTNRTTVFNKETATAGITFSAVDAQGNEVVLTQEDVVISDWTTIEGETANEATHSATVTFLKDGNYTWSFAYTDDADNALSLITTGENDSTYAFTVDMTAPTGDITIETSTWDDLIEKLTFGLYSKNEVVVSATSDDATSPIYKVEYYQTNNTTAMTQNELDEVEFSDFTSYKVSSDTLFVVYLKITDCAGQYTYISSNGYIVDLTSSSITLTPSMTNGNEEDSTKYAIAKTNGVYGIYNSDAVVTIDVTVEDQLLQDSLDYSGIATVDYWIVKDGDSENPTQEGNLFTFTNSNPTQAQLVHLVTTQIEVDTALNNSSDVVVYVKTTDNAGNSYTRSVSLDIDITAPTIEISFDNNSDNDSNTNFDADRTATIVITERTEHFDADEVIIEIQAANALGEQVENAYTISDWVTVEGDTADDATHTLTIHFAQDANYEWSISYTDNAGNVSKKAQTGDSVAPYIFTVDTTAPTGTITAASTEGRESIWSSLKKELTFGYWSQQEITITATSDDITSKEIASVEYYKLKSTSATDGATALTTADLDAITSWTAFEDLSVSSDEQFVIYLKITDLAGNYTYISTNGLIVDHTAPIEELYAPEISLSTNDGEGLYSDDVVISVEVTDPLTGSTYSGLQTITYKVYNMGVETQSGTLYTFDISEPTQSELLYSWTGEIVVDSELNNSNDVVIEVYASDNALNSSDNEIAIQIDTTAPQIDVAYDNNDADSSTYFLEDRTATIVITERNFDSSDVIIALTNTDGVIPTLSSWTQTAGQGNLDDTTWTATITYTADGDYEFGISYTDLAGWTCEQDEVDYGSSVAATSFTIDQTNPAISVSYDNNSATNTSYYSAQRTATVVIDEHNLEPNGADSDRVVITTSATDDGAVTTSPTVSSWTTNGDTHTATIYYSADALYSFDISVTDKAGNDSDDFEEQSFYVDTTAPELEISGVEDLSANSGDVVPVITYSDTNYSSQDVTITLTGANLGTVELDGSYSQITNGGVFTFNNFPVEEDIDDIYTLTATLSDMAGNSTTQTITFSVNRFGSTYTLSEATQALNNTYVKDPIDVEIIEINANELSDIKITLFKNNESSVLTEGSDYEIILEGGDGQWYHYTYVIYAQNFEDDGVYSLTVESTDAAGNYAKNDLDTKETLLNFGVDNTMPIVNLINVQSKTTYALDNLTVEFSVSDNLKLDQVIVELDGEEIMTLSGDELDELIAAGGNFSFDISGDSTSEHNLIVYAVDAAGNGAADDGDSTPENAGVAEEFFVTTNLWVRYYTNKALFYGSIGGTILVAGLGIFLVVRRKNKKAA